jgi:FkbM family methyltransferase
MKRIIYDIGSNNGDDIPYYLNKADRVIAVEANPLLCSQIKKRFQSEIDMERLIIENSVLVSKEYFAESVDFYIHSNEDVLSQFLPPKNLDMYRKVKLPAITVSDLIRNYGEPYYIKIDVEHYDELILNDFFDNNVKPPFISCESHSSKIFSLLVTKGGYDAFKLVDGESVPTKFAKHRIFTNNSAIYFSFPRHSAGPFGDDIPGDWMTADNFFSYLAFEGLGWKDIHATNIYKPNPLMVVTVESYLDRLLVIRLKKFLPDWLKKLIKFFIFKSN